MTARVPLSKARDSGHATSSFARTVLAFGVTPRGARSIPGPPFPLHDPRRASANPPAST